MSEKIIHLNKYNENQKNIIINSKEVYFLTYKNFYLNNEKDLNLYNNSSKHIKTKPKLKMKIKIPHQSEGTVDKLKLIHADFELKKLKNPEISINNIIKNDNKIIDNSLDISNIDIENLEELKKLNNEKIKEKNKLQFNNTNRYNSVSSFKSYPKIDTSVKVVKKITKKLSLKKIEKNLSSNNFSKIQENHTDKSNYTWKNSQPSLICVEYSKLSSLTNKLQEIQNEITKLESELSKKNKNKNINKEKKELNVIKVEKNILKQNKQIENKKILNEILSNNKDLENHLNDKKTNLNNSQNKASYIETSYMKFINSEKKKHTNNLKNNKKKSVNIILNKNFIV